MSKLENLLAHASSVLSTQSGLDAGLHLMQYSSPLVAAALLKLVQKRAEAGVKSPELINISTGIVRAGTSLGEARTIMRAFGEYPTPTPTRPRPGRRRRAQNECRTPGRRM